jgi:hypothetical protein
MYTRRRKRVNKYNRILQSKKLNFKQKYDKLFQLQCSPISKQKNNKKYTCLPDDILLKLREMWNARHPDVMIHSKSSEDIWYLLKKLLGNIILNILFIKLIKQIL